MEAIASSDAAVALVSQDFLKSGFISEAEVPLLARRHRESRNQLFCMYVRHSTVTDHLYEDNGNQREHVLIFVNDKDMRWLDSPHQPLREGDEITILQAVSGG